MIESCFHGEVLKSHKNMRKYIKKTSIEILVRKYNSIKRNKKIYGIVKL